MSDIPSNRPSRATQALDFKSATLYALRVVLQSSDMAELRAALDKRMHDAGSFFENEPIVVDASQVEAPLDWKSFLQALRSHRLHPMGVVAEGENLELARASGLIAVDLAAAPARPPAVPAPEAEVPPLSPPPTPAPAPAPPKARPAAAATPPQSVPPEMAPAAMVINRPLRSGQRIYARHTDLIVIGAVNQGAEIIADGNIHVYGVLRGKAMAGARGDSTARIFTTHLDAELVAIAGVYRVIEAKLDDTLHKQAVIVQLEGEALRIVPLST